MRFWEETWRHEGVRTSWFDACREEPVAPGSIIGRNEESGAVARFFDREPSGACGLLIEGEAGIGKTAMWREAVRIAGAKGTVLTARASEAEARLSFTVLGDLLVPAMNDEVLGQLSAPQRRGLEVALLLVEPTQAGPDHRAVARAVLSVLHVLAKTRHLTLAVDDVQWVDAPSARALAFALRRLEAEPVTVVAARRLERGSGEPLDLVHTLPAGFEQLALGPLDEPSLGRLLRRSLDREFPPPLVRRIHEQTAGNPFFAIEVGRALGTQSLSLQPGEPLPVPHDLETLLRRRISALSTGGRDASLLMAASPVPSRDIVEAAGGSARAIQEAIDGGIVVIQGRRLEFSHPLLASTVYGSASDREWRLAHARLAKVASDPEERARHLALSMTGPNENVAVALAEAAQHAHDRGAPLAAAELFEMAATLTPAPSDLIRVRHLEAAANLFDAGDGDGARGMVEKLVRQLEPGEGRADALRHLVFMSWDDVHRVSTLVPQALDEAGNNASLRSMILVDAAWAEFEACRPATASDLGRSALALAEPLSDPFPKRYALSILSWAQAVLGRPADALVERAVALEGTTRPGESTGAAITHGWLLLWAGELEAARNVMEASLQRCLDQGRDAATWEIIVSLAQVEFRAGRWALAADHVRTALEIALETGRSKLAGQILPIKAAIASATGDVEQALEDALQSLSLCERQGDRFHELASRAALGFLEISRGDPAATHEWLAPATTICREMGLREPGVYPFVPDEVEAFVGLGQLDEAERLTEELEEQGERLDRALAVATAGRCRSLIAGARGELDEAADRAERALATHAGTAQPFELGRTLLVAGVIQRRMKHKRAARDHLEHARKIFEELGAPLWSAKARVELARIGGRARVGELTDTERAVANLAADGVMNQEIADRMFISVKTVEANLSRVYGKLQIRSRRELPKALGRLGGGGEQT
jgi:DNA-binding CsgD family transcriptional regulator